MTVVAHFESRVPRPSVPAKTSRSLLTPRAVVPGWTLAPGHQKFASVRSSERFSIFLNLRQSESPLHATAAVVTRAAPARLPLAEVSRPAGALGDYVHSHADQGGSVRVHHVRQTADVQRVRAATLAHFVLVVTLVDTHHGYVDTHLLLDLKMYLSIFKVARFVDLIHIRLERKSLLWLNQCNEKQVLLLLNSWNWKMFEFTSFLEKN